MMYRLVLVVGAVAAVGPATDQRRADQILRDRFSARSSLSAEFVATFTSQLLERERRVGERSLGREPGRELDDELAQIVDAFGFEAAQRVRLS